MTPRDSESVLDRLDRLEREATAGPWTLGHKKTYEEARIYAGGAVRALLDGRQLLNERADAELLVLLRNHAADLLAAVAAARSVYLGLTCQHDPMDVDERIERLGAALSFFTADLDTGAEGAPRPERTQ